ncbi:MAG: thioredoxin family protein [Planctomycetota bacterium]
MRSSKWFAALVLLFTLGAAPALGQPAVFTRGTFEQAMDWSRANDEGVLVVSFTATWCGPCKRMDADAWRDRRVESLVRGSGYAVKVDIDQRRDIASSYGVRGVPTTVLVRAGEEVARRVGYLDADRTLAWLEGAATTAASETEASDETAATATLAEDLEEVRVLAGRDAARGADRAIEAWRSAGEGLSGDWAGVAARRELARVMAAGAEADESARARVESLRGEIMQSARGLESRAEHEAVMERWVALSASLGENEGVWEWFDSAYDARRRRQIDEGLAAELADALARTGRWRDAGRLIRDAGAVAEREAGIAAMAMASDRADADRAMADRVGRLHASLIAASKLRPAWALVDDVLAGSGRNETLDGVRMAMVGSAIEAGVAQPRHRKLLASCAGDTSALSERLESAL